jgi:hypothetical protein
LANPCYKPADNNELLPKVDEILHYANEVSQPDSKAGDAVAQDAVLVELETDKVALEITTPVAGILRAVAADTGSTVIPGDLLASVEPSVASAWPLETAPLSKVALAKPVIVAQPDACPAPVIARPAPPSRNERREPMSQMRRALARQWKAVQNGAATLTTFNDIDVTAILALRARYAVAFEKCHGAPTWADQPLRAGDHPCASRLRHAQCEGRRRRDCLSALQRYCRVDRYAAGHGCPGPPQRREDKLRRDRNASYRADAQGTGRRARFDGFAGRHLYDPRPAICGRVDLQPASQRGTKRCSEPPQDRGASGGGQRRSCRVR